VTHHFLHLDDGWEELRFAATEATNEKSVPQLKDMLVG
jgi:hypothetical protein